MYCKASVMAYRLPVTKSIKVKSGVEISPSTMYHALIKNGCIRVAEFRKKRGTNR